MTKYILDVLIIFTLTISTFQNSSNIRERSERNKLCSFQKCLLSPVYLERMYRFYISFGNQLFIRRTKDCEILFGKECKRPINKYTEQSAVTTFLMYPISLPLEYISNPRTIYTVLSLYWGGKRRKHQFLLPFFLLYKIMTPWSYVIFK